MLPSLIALLWLSSPALPVGGFSYSEGLEGAIAGEWVHDAESASTWLVDQLHLSLARSDMAALALSVQAARANDTDALARVSQWVRCTRESAQARLQSEQMGKSMGAWAHAACNAAGQAGPNQPYPVAYALAAVQLAPQASVADIATAYGFAWSEGMVGAAVRAVPLGQTAGQHLLRRLGAELPQAVHVATHTPFADLQAFTPNLAVVSSQHEHQYTRLFRS